MQDNFSELFQNLVFSVKLIIIIYNNFSKLKSNLL